MISDGIPVIRSYETFNPHSGIIMYWQYEGLFKYKLMYNNKPILYSVKKFETYKRDNIMGSETFMYLYDMDDNLHEKVFRKESQHNEPHIPELNDPLVLVSIERFLRNYKIKELLDG